MDDNVRKLRERATALRDSRECWYCAKPLARWGFFTRNIYLADLRRMCEDCYARVQSVMVETAIAEMRRRDVNAAS